MVDDGSTDDCARCGGCLARREFLVRFGVSMAAAVAAIAADATSASARASRTLADHALLRTEPKSYAIPAADGATIDADNEVILMRWQSAVYAFALACPHQNTALRWRGDDGRFQCPKHKSQYRPDGSFIEGRATRGMDRYAIRREGPNVIVEVQTLFRSSDNPQEWAAALVKLS